MNATTDIIFESIAKAGMVASTTLNGLPAMSSLEIAEITGKKHRDVLRDIRKMLNEVGALLRGLQCVETSYRDSQNKSQPLIVLDKELTFTLLTGYNATLRLLVNRRWLELEGSGFERISVQATVVHLVEREKDIRRDALKSLKRNTPKKLTAEQKEFQKYLRQANAEARRDRLKGREVCYALSPDSRPRVPSGPLRPAQCCSQHAQHAGSTTRRGAFKSHAGTTRSIAFRRTSSNPHGSQLASWRTSSNEPLCRSMRPCCCQSGSI
jgi:phage regulator Rha-like protein